MTSRLIAGVDEAGRGPWAGPVVVAAVILNPDYQISGLDDSKKISIKKRELLYTQIIEKSRSYSCIFLNVPLIDRINILAATKIGMQRAVTGLSIQPDEVMIDGRDAPKMPCTATTVIGGDALIAEISAASIVAKVMRDRYMERLHLKYPQYNFASHKGYGTKVHKEAIEQYGVLIHHRKSYAPIKKILHSNMTEAIQ